MPTQSIALSTKAPSTGLTDHRVCDRPPEPDPGDSSTSPSKKSTQVEISQPVSKTENLTPASLAEKSDLDDLSKPHIVREVRHLRHTLNTRRAYTARGVENVRLAKKIKLQSLFDYSPSDSEEEEKEQFVLSLPPVHLIGTLHERLLRAARTDCAVGSNTATKAAIKGALTDIIPRGGMMSMPGKVNDAADSINGAADSMNDFLGRFVEAVTPTTQKVRAIATGAGGRLVLLCICVVIMIWLIEFLVRATTAGERLVNEFIKPLLTWLKALGVFPIAGLGALTGGMMMLISLHFSESNQNQDDEEEKSPDSSSSSGPQSSTADDPDQDDPSDDIRPQFANEVGAEAVLAVIVCSLVSANELNPTDGLMPRITKVISALPKVERGLESLSRAASWLLRALPEGIQSALMMRTHFSGHLDCEPEMAQYVEDAFSVISRRTAKPDLICDPVFRAEVSFMYSRYAELMKDELTCLGRAATTYRIIADCYTKLSALAIECGVATEACKTRPTPVGLYICGPTSIGKSGMLSSLTAAMFPYASAEQRTFSVPEEEEAFWTNYYHQLSLLYEDFESDKESKASVLLLKILSNAPWPVKQAEIDRKGDMIKDLKLVIVNSNTPLEKTRQCLSNNPAFRERFWGRNGVYATAVLQKPFATKDKTLDAAKVMALDPDSLAKLPWLKFKVAYKDLSGTMTRRLITFDSLVTLLTRKIASSQAAHDCQNKSAEYVERIWKRKMTPPKIDDVEPQMKSSSKASAKAFKRRVKSRAKRREGLCGKVVSPSSSDTADQSPTTADFNSDVGTEYSIKFPPDIPEPDDSDDEPPGRPAWGSCETFPRESTPDEHKLPTHGPADEEGVFPVDTVPPMYRPQLEGSSFKQEGSQSRLEQMTWLYRVIANVPEELHDTWGSLWVLVNFYAKCTNVDLQLARIPFTTFLTAECRRSEHSCLPQFFDVYDLMLYRVGQLLPYGPRKLAYLSALGAPDDIIADDIFTQVIAAVPTPTISMRTGAPAVNVRVPECGPHSKDHKARSEEDRFKLNWYDYYRQSFNDKMYEVLGTNWDLVAGFIKGVVIWGGIYHGFKAISAAFHKTPDEPEPDDVEPQSWEQHPGRTAARSRKRGNKRAATHKGVHIVNDRHVSYLNRGNTHPRSDEVKAYDDWDPGVRSKLEHACAHVSNSRGGQGAIRISGRVLWLNRHFFRRYDRVRGEVGYMAEDETFVVQFHDREPLTFGFESARLLVIPDDEGLPSDECLYNLPGHPQGVAPAPNIIKYVADLTEKNKYKRIMGCQFISAHLDEADARYYGKAEPLGVATRRDHQIEWSSVYYLEDKDGKKYKNETHDTVAHEFYAYKDLPAGTCAGMVVAMMEGQPRIVALHAASRREPGSENYYGLGLVASRKDLLSGIEHFAEDDIHVRICSEELTSEQFVSRDDFKDYTPEGNFTLLGQISRRTTAESKTNYERSPIADAVEISKLCLAEPPILSTRDERSENPEIKRKHGVLIKAASKNGTTRGHFPNPEDEKAVNNAVNDIILSRATRKKKAVLTEFEAINGDHSGDVFPGLKGLNMASSEGLPLSDDRPAGVRGKKYLFETHEDPVDGRKTYTVQSPALRARLDMLLVEMKKGIVPLALWLTFLKDELRSPIKIAAGDTRHVCTSAVAFTIVTRMYWGCLGSHMNTIFRDTEFMVGINPYSRDWDDMINRVLAVATQGFDGDYSKFSSRICQLDFDAWNGLGDAFYDCATDQDAMVRRVCVSMMNFSAEVIADCVFRSNSAQPDGNGITIHLNNYTNARWVRMAYCHIARQAIIRGQIHERCRGMEGFNKYVVLCLYGDDNLVGTHHELKGVFNAKSVSEYMAQANIKYTDANKGATDATLRSIKELSFIGNTTAYGTYVQGCKYYPIVDEASLAKTLAWVRTENLDPIEAAIGNATGALYRAWGRGPTYFESLKLELTKAFADLDQFPPLPGWDDIRNRWDKDLWQIPEAGSFHVNYAARRFGHSSITEETIPRGQTISVTKNLNIEHVVDSTLSVKGDASDFEQGQSLDADVTASQDKPNVGLNPFPFVRRAFPFLSNSCNITYAQRMGMQPGGAMMPHPEDIATTTNEASLDRMITTPSWMSTTRWEAAALPGDVLATGAICPGAELLDAFTGEELDVPLLTYVCAKFRYWTGGLTLYFDLSMAGPMTGRLVLFTRYSENGLVAPSLEEGSMQYAHVMEVNSDSTEFAVTIPYRSPNNWSRVPNGPQAIQRSIGTWWLMVLNPLKTMSTTADYAWLNVAVAGAPDMKFDYYGRTNQYLTPVILPSIPAAVAAEAKAEEKEDIIPQMEQKEDAGVSFDESLPEPVTHSHQAPVSTSALAQAAVNEHDFTFVKLLERQQLITTFEWSVSDLQDEELLRARIPYGFVKGQLSIPFKQFLFNHCDCEITIKINGTPFHNGSLLGWFVPLTPEIDIDEHHATSRASQSIVQNMRLHANRANSATMRINYIQYQRMLETDDETIDSGGFRLSVWNELATAATNPQTLTGSVFVSFPASKLRVLNPAAVPVVEPASLHVKSRPSMMVGDTIPSMLASEVSLTTQEVAVPVEVGVGAGDSKPVKPTEKTDRYWSDLGKRAGLISSLHQGVASVHEYGVATNALMLPNASTLVNGVGMAHQSWLAAPFRLYNGSITHHMLGRVHGIVAYQPGAMGFSPITPTFLTHGAPMSNSGPFDLLSPLSGTTAVTTPMTTRYSCLLVPKKAADLLEENSSPGRLYIRTEAEIDFQTQPFQHFMGFGDDFSLHQLYAVPRIKIGSSNVGDDHYADSGATVNVPQFLKIEHGGQEVCSLSQDWFARHQYSLDVTGSTPFVLESISSESADLSNADLRAFGIDISDTQVPVEVLGLSATVNRILTHYSGLPSSRTLEWDSGTQSQGGPFPMHGDLLNPTVVGGRPTGTGFVLGPESWTNTDALTAYYDMPAGNTPVAVPGVIDTKLVALVGHTVSGVRYGAILPEPNLTFLSHV